MDWAQHALSPYGMQSNYSPYLNTNYSKHHPYSSISKLGGACLEVACTVYGCLCIASHTVHASSKACTSELKSTGNFSPTKHDVRYIVQGGHQWER